MFKIRFVDDAVEDIQKLDKSIVRRIIRKIEWLAENAETIQPLGLRGDLSGFAKLREGDYRIIYELLYEDKIVVVHFVGHRSEVYKR